MATDFNRNNLHIKMVELVWNYSTTNWIFVPRKATKSNFVLLAVPVSFYFKIWKQKIKKNIFQNFLSFCGEQNCILSARQACKSKKYVQEKATKKTHTPQTNRTCKHENV
jgi:hypothetical protein